MMAQLSYMQVIKGQLDGSQEVAIKVLSIAGGLQDKHLQVCACVSLGVSLHACLTL